MTNRFRACAYKRGGHKRGEPNKVETKFLEHCATMQMVGQVHSYHFEGHQFWLPGRVPFLPDVELIQANGEIWQVDVKATNRKLGKPLITESARNKMKVAAATFPHYRWFIAFILNGYWEYEEFGL